MAKLVLVDLDFNGVTKLINLPDAVANQEPVTLAQLNASVEALQDKGVAVAATVGNINLASPGATISAVTMAVNDPFLVLAQTLPAENGLYIWNGAAVSATRSPKMSISSEFNNALVRVKGGTGATDGTTNPGITYRQTALNPTVGATAINFIVFGSGIPSATESISGIAEIATQVEADAGVDDTRFITPLKLKNSLFYTRKYSATFGDGVATQYDITHNLNSLDAHIAIYLISTGNEVLIDMVRLTVNTVRITASSPIATNTLRCVVVV